MMSSRPISVHTDFPQGAAFKTPGRALQHRSALQENAGTVHRAGGKNMILQTPAKGLNASYPTQTPAPGKGAGAAGKAPVLTIGRPLGDKTPFPNRGLNRGFPVANIELDGSLLPSSARKSSRRSSRGFGSLGVGELNFATLGLGKFQTPRVNGNPWDVEDVELEAHAEEAEAALLEEVETEDFDEFEYMPPTALNMPYRPMFDMPDYKKLGGTLASFHHTFQVDDVPAYPAHSEAEEQALVQIALTVLPELAPEDDTPFYFSRTPSPPSAPGTSTAVKQSSRQGPTGSSSRPPVRTTTTASRTPTTTKSSTTLPSSRSIASTKLDLNKPTTSNSRTAAPRPATSMARPMTSMARRAPDHSTTTSARPATSMARARPATSMARVPPAPTTSRLAPSASQAKIVGSTSQSKLAATKPTTASATKATIAPQTSRPGATSSSRLTGARSGAGQTTPRPKSLDEVILTFEDEPHEDFQFEL